VADADVVAADEVPLLFDESEFDDEEADDDKLFVVFCPKSGRIDAELPPCRLIGHFFDMGANWPKLLVVIEVPP
jgi:hypothetical protein